LISFEEVQGHHLKTDILRDMHCLFLEKKKLKIMSRYERFKMFMYYVCNTEIRSQWLTDCFDPNYFSGISS